MEHFTRHIISQILTILLFGIACSVLFRFVFLLDLQKRVYNHAPGECRIVENIGTGSMGMEYIAELNLIFIVSGFARSKNSSISSSIFYYKFGESRKKAIRMKIEGKTFNHLNFAPTGISSYVSRGRVSLYVSNFWPGNHSIEIFTLNKDRMILVHRKSIRDRILKNPADIAVVGADRFIVTNIMHTELRLIQFMEIFLQTSFGSIIYFDGKRFSYLERYFPSPNGIVVSSDHLYVASTFNEFVRIYKLKRDMSIEKEMDINILSSPHKIFVDSQGDIWVASHPILHMLFHYLLNLTINNQISPSQILRIRLQEGNKSWIITEPFINDGATISASSSVVYHKKEMLIGSISSRLIHCDIQNPDIT